jgi:hypothetical protein
MTVYVDDMQMAATVGRYTAKWSHLTADTKAELHAFAARLQLQRKWFQDKPRGLWHYDVTEGKRQQAIRLGAVEIMYGATSPWFDEGREQ